MLQGDFGLVLALFGVGISVVSYWGPVLLARVFGYPVDQVSKLLGLGQIAWAVAGATFASAIFGFAMLSVVAEVAPQ